MVQIMGIVMIMLRLIGEDFLKNEWWWWCKDWMVNLWTSKVCQTHICCLRALTALPKSASVQAKGFLAWGYVETDRSAFFNWFLINFLGDANAKYKETNYK